MTKFWSLFFLFAVSQNASAGQYPEHWWKPVPKETAPAWEVLPQEAGPGEVILSKRNELGIFSNFADTPFVFRGKRYASLEGFWQATKYPEDKKDPRFSFPGLTWPYTRAEVSQLTGFEAKKAGDLGKQNMKIMGIDWVTFEGEKLIYREEGESPFYLVIREAMKAKLEQNPEVERLLKMTGNLKLRPDHLQTHPNLRAWQYHQIWMDFRSEL